MKFENLFELPQTGRFSLVSIRLAVLKDKTGTYHQSAYGCGEAEKNRGQEALTRRALSIKDKMCPVCAEHDTFLFVRRSSTNPKVRPFYGLKIENILKTRELLLQREENFHEPRTHQEALELLEELAKDTLETATFESEHEELIIAQSKWALERYPGISMLFLIAEQLGWGKDLEKSRENLTRKIVEEARKLDDTETRRKMAKEAAEMLLKHSSINESVNEELQKQKSKIEEALTQDADLYLCDLENASSESDALIDLYGAGIKKRENWAIVPAAIAQKYSLMRCETVRIGPEVGEKEHAAIETAAVLYSLRAGSVYDTLETAWQAAIKL